MVIRIWQHSLSLCACDFSRLCIISRFRLNLSFVDVMHGYSVQFIWLRFKLFPWNKAAGWLEKLMKFNKIMSAAILAGTFVHVHRGMRLCMCMCVCACVWVCVRVCAFVCMCTEFDRHFCIGGDFLTVALGMNRIRIDLNEIRWRALGIETFPLPIVEIIWNLHELIYHFVCFSFILISLNLGSCTNRWLTQEFRWIKMPENYAK